MRHNDLTDTLATITRPRHKTLTEETVTAITEAIRQEKFSPGSQLPPELELMEMLGVSRTTLREALRTLEEQGLIFRKRGLGTFVSITPILKDLSSNFGITDMIREAGLMPGTSTIDIRVATADLEVAQALGLPEGARVLRIDRIRTADDKPVVVTTDILPSEIFEGKMITTQELQDQSLYQYLLDEKRLQILHGDARIYAVPATTRIASQLNVTRGTPLLRITQIDYTIDNRPILYSDEYHLTGSFIFMIHRKGPHSY